MALIAGAVFSSQAQAAAVDGTFTPLITAGALPDSPNAHIDPNTPSSAYSGVVSINIRYDGQSFLCSGALVGKRQVISAGHCVDSDGNGHLVDINKPGNDVRVVFNSNGNVNALITASQISMNPNYAGFGNCPAGVNSFCVNDDVSVITLSQDAPASAKIYSISGNPVTSGTHIIMAGYGTTGDGVNGYQSGSASFTKNVLAKTMSIYLTATMSKILQVQMKSIIQTLMAAEKILSVPSMVFALHNWQITKNPVSALVIQVDHLS